MFIYIRFASYLKYLQKRSVFIGGDKMRKKSSDNFDDGSNWEPERQHTDEKPNRQILDEDGLLGSAKKIWYTYKKRITLGAAGLFLGITVLSNAYTIPQDSVGVVTTFGAYSRTQKPGLNFKVPFIESVEKVQNQAILTESFGFRPLKPGVKSEYIGVKEIQSGNIDKDRLEEIVKEEGVSADGNITEKAMGILKSEYLMLTGDLNMADVESIVQYKIKDPAAYLFNVRNPRDTLRDLAEATTRTVIGDASVDEVITIGRTDIEIKAKEKLQERLNYYNTGLEVVTVKLQSANVPERVRPSFNAVNSAIQNKQEKINNAMQEYNKVIPRATGEAQGLISQATGYATERVNRATGDASRFNSIFLQYKDAPAITRSRMYLEAMPDILRNSEKIYFIEGDGGKGSLLLQKLDLDKERKN
jgi:modulator of FtsH protease HflK